MKTGGRQAMTGTADEYFIRLISPWLHVVVERDWPCV